MSNQDLIVQEQNSGFMQVNTLEGAMKCADIIASSSFCPKGMMGKPGDVLVALQMGQELGLRPMQALQNIAVINGRPSLWGDAMLAVCRRSPDWEYIKEDFDDTNKVAICTVKRRNEPEIVRTFSYDDAKQANLLNKEGPWKQYPKRMCQLRARGFALRDGYADELRGIISKEEAEDMPREKIDYSDAKGAVIIDAVISDDQFSILIDKIEAAGSQPADILKFLGIDNIRDMTMPQWKEVVTMLDKKIKKRRVDGLEINQVLDAQMVEEKK